MRREERTDKQKRVKIRGDKEKRAGGEERKKKRT